MPNFVSFATSIAELVNGEKLRTQSLIQSLSLFDAPGTKAYASDYEAVIGRNHTDNANHRQHCLHHVNYLYVLNDYIHRYNCTDSPTKICEHTKATAVAKRLQKEIDTSFDKNKR